MRNRFHFILAILTLLFYPFLMKASNQGDQNNESPRPTADKILFIGDSMTGWMSERFNAYAHSNGFEVAAIIWDGSTISKWGANSSILSHYVKQIKPDAIFISLGLNDLAEKNPGTRLTASVNNILKATSGIPIVWIGPPSWPGKPWGEPLNSWLAEKLGKGHYFSSLTLKLPRQSASNPHPSREGINIWMDDFINWLRKDGAVALPGYSVPLSNFSRPKTFIYRKMKQPL